MSQKDTGSFKAKPQQGGSTSGKRGNTKTRMQAASKDESGKVTADLSGQQLKAEAAKMAGQANSEPAEGDNVRGLWKSKVLASYHGANNQPHGADGGGEQDYADAVHEAMISIIDRIFDIFQNSAYEFNKIAAGSELELNWVRPFLTKEGAPSWLGSNVEPVTVFTGRMSTRLWTLIMKGTSEMVQTYILPTSKLMTFNISSGTFKPYLQLEPHFDQGTLGWRLGTHEISPALLQPIARELFNALIRFAKNEVHEDEEFDLVNIGLVAPTPVEDPQVEIDRKRFYQQAFLEDLKSHLDTRRDVRSPDGRDAQPERSGPPPSEFNQPLPDHIRRELEVLKDGGAPAVVPSNAFLTGGAAWKSVADAPPEKLDPNISKQLQRMAEEATGMSGSQPPQGANPNAQPNQHLQQAQHPNSAPPQPPAPPAQQMMQSPAARVQAAQQSQNSGQPVPTPGRNPAAPQLPPGQPQQAMRPPVPAAPQGQDPAAQSMAAAQSLAMAAAQAAAQAAAGRTQPMNLPAALSVLLASLDREMEVVAKAGADAFAQRDLGRADAALKFSARLSEYRNMSQELLDYYKRKR